MLLLDVGASATSLDIVFFKSDIMSCTSLECVDLVFISSWAASSWIAVDSPSPTSSFFLCDFLVFLWPWALRVDADDVPYLAAFCLCSASDCLLSVVAILEEIKWSISLDEDVNWDIKSSPKNLPACCCWLASTIASNWTA